jgi:ESAT-6 family protein
MSFSFNFPVAEQTIGTMDKTNTEIQTELDELERFVEAQLGDWAGDARDGYLAAKKEWDGSAVRMVQALAQARSALINISDGFGGADAGAASGWQA